MNYFEGTRKFEFVLSGYTWKLDLTFEKANELYQEGITLTEVSDVS